MKARSSLSRLILLAGFVLAHAAHAATAYYVTANSVYARSQPHEFAMGRLYTDDRMDIQDIDPEGWAYGYAYGYINRCVWAQFRQSSAVYFRTNGTTVSDKCRTTNRYLDRSEFTTGEVWGTTDGVFVQLARDSYTWDNWVWGAKWGNHTYRGISPAGSGWKVRYTTYDGGGVMARPCYRNAANEWVCMSDWYFIQRNSFDYYLPCGRIAPGEVLGFGATLNSCDGRFSLTLQRDGNMVLYQNGYGNYTSSAIWASNTSGNSTNLGYMQPDGNFVLYNASGSPYWATNTSGQSVSRLALQNDGNLVLYNTGGAPIWASNTCCR